MLEKGRYRIVQVLSISSSLASQIECLENKPSGIHKCLAEMGPRQTILYFVDGIDFGQGSTIELLADLKTPLVYKSEYRILERAPLAHEVEFIKRLKSLQSAKDVQ